MDVSIHDETFWTGSRKATSSFGLELRLIVYPKFEEYVSYTLQNMMGDLGGTIGLWMGASFLSIIHVIVFFAKRCTNLREKCFGSAQK